ncbi:glycine-rich protein DC7.1-like [Alnus glutinosa]|uniref:glycine-rich protein DC7.1-like n=1 Tax=Alnus glutinosa TaxID=3517 RepID=UPI002D794A09|nr:glycine-rich protein DC7.1-like [Alnus glutinosa]
MGSNSKAFLLLGLLLAIVLLDSSEVSARDLAKTSSDQGKVDATKEANGVDDTKYGEFGGKPAGGYGGYIGGGYGGYQGGPSRDPRILSGGNGGRHPCPVEGSGHCSPPGAETEAKLQN